MAEHLSLALDDFAVTFFATTYIMKTTSIPRFHSSIESPVYMI